MFRPFRIDSEKPVEVVKQDHNRMSAQVVGKRQQGLSVNEPFGRKALIPIQIILAGIVKKRLRDLTRRRIN